MSAGCFFPFSQWVDDMADAGANMYTFHIEATSTYMCIPTAWYGVYMYMMLHIIDIQCSTNVCIHCVHVCKYSTACEVTTLVGMYSTSTVHA